MSRVIVTGGAGFIGSHLTDKLIKLGHDVLVIDDLSTGNIKNLNKKAKFLEEDISTDKFLWGTRNEFCDIGKLTQEIDYIFHLAALPRVSFSIEHPLKTHRVNTLGTLHMILLAKEKKTKKIIFASSSSVYGNQELPLKETMVPKPISPYAFHKRIGEEYFRIFNDLYNIPYICLRYFNVYGRRANADSDYSLVIAKFLKMKKEGKPLTIYGTGEQTRDFTYVDDVVDACILAMEKPVQNKVINICNGQGVSVNKIAEIIGGEKTYLPPRLGDIEHTLGDNNKAKKLLGWRPKVSIEEGIKLCQIHQ